MVCAKNTEEDMLQKTYLINVKFRTKERLLLPDTSCSVQ